MGQSVLQLSSSQKVATQVQMTLDFGRRTCGAETREKQMSNDGQAGPATEDGAHPLRSSSPKPRRTDKWNTASAAWSCATNPSCLLRTSSVSVAVKRARRPKPIASYARQPHDGDAGPEGNVCAAIL